MALVNPGTWSIGGVNLPDFGITELIPAAQQIFQNAGYNQQQTGASVIEGVTPRALGGTGLVAPAGTTPAYASGSIPKTTTPPPTTTQNPTNNTRYVSEQDALALGLDWNNLPGGYARAGGGGGTVNTEDLLNQIFNPAYAQLSQEEQTARDLQPQIEQNILDQYGTSKSALEGERTSGMNQIGQSEQSTFNRKEDAASAARRLYDELVRGGRQRFGGATSAGQAYGELTAAEQQRRMGGIQTQYNEAMSKLDLAKSDLNQKFTNAIAELENQKNTAILDAQREFRNRLDQISAARRQTDADKAQMRMQELQNYRNMVYQINLQDYQYKQQLAANKQASESAVDQARQRLLASAGMGSAAYQQFLGNSTINPTTGLTMGYTPTAQNLAMTGQTTGTRKYDEFGNPIA